jgi:ribonuclease HI
MIYVVYSDGACRGNPGPMAIGASIQADRGAELAMISQLLGTGTNTSRSTRRRLKD